MMGAVWKTDQLSSRKEETQIGDYRTSQGRNCGGLDWAGCANSEKGQDSGCELKIELTEFAPSADVEWKTEREEFRIIPGLVLSSWGKRWCCNKSKGGVKREHNFGPGKSEMPSRYLSTMLGGRQAYEFGAQWKGQECGYKFRSHQQISVLALNVSTDEEVLRTESCAISIVRGQEKQTNKQKKAKKKKGNQEKVASNRSGQRGE